MLHRHHYPKGALYGRTPLSGKFLKIYQSRNEAAQSIRVLTEFSQNQRPILMIDGGRKSLPVGMNNGRSLVLVRF